jgi:hypothetical protein
MVQEVYIDYGVGSQEIKNYYAMTHLKHISALSERTVKAWYPAREGERVAGRKSIEENGKRDDVGHGSCHRER